MKSMLLAGIAAGGLLVALSGTTMAQTLGTQDPSVTGQGNRCWGKTASATAQLPSGGVDASGTEIKGGAMGAHSRSTPATENVGGFANESNVVGISFNDGEASEGLGGGGNGNGRNGVANQTRTFGTEPGDGGQGVHATANIGAANFLDPVTGGLSGGQNDLAQTVDPTCLP